MKKAVRAMVLFVLQSTPAYQARKREVLSERLHRVFYMDALEGQLDMIVRRKYN